MPARLGEIPPLLIAWYRRAGYQDRETDAVSAKAGLPVPIPTGIPVIVRVLIPVTLAHFAF